jgi:hypothetical protein
MTSIITAFVLSVILVSLLLIAGCFGNTTVIKIQQAMAQNSDSSQSHINKAAFNAGSPEKMTISGQSKPPVLSPEKKQVLEQDQAKIHHNPKLPSSDQPVLGPILGTQAQ